ncbi:hypothetical protein J6590_099201 [Homalodisca vitripennis]|nr:hypothetical protein J6590_099201 [Homalodisca vitripennis]
MYCYINPNSHLDVNTITQTLGFEWKWLIDGLDSTSRTEVNRKYLSGSYLHRIPGGALPINLSISGIFRNGFDCTILLVKCFESDNDTDLTPAMVGRVDAVGMLSLAPVHPVPIAASSNVQDFHDSRFQESSMWQHIKKYYAKILPSQSTSKKD